jgi:hypothetical protein
VLTVSRPQNGASEEIHQTAPERLTPRTHKGDSATFPRRRRLYNYNVDAQCTPTRSAIMTGRMPAKEVVIGAGRGAGKDSFASLILAVNAINFDPKRAKLRPGEFALRSICCTEARHLLASSRSSSSNSSSCQRLNASRSGGSSKNTPFLPVSSVTTCPP